MSKEKLIPELRFPEFDKDGGWRIQELNNHIDFQTGYPFKSKYFNIEGQGIRLVKNRDLKSDDSIVYFEGEFSEDYIIKDGDILVGMDGDFTPRYWNKGKALLNQRVGRVMAKNKKTERFFEYFLTLQLQEIEKNTARTTVKHLSHSVVQKIRAPLPKPQEQQKIAACLCSLDEVISAHNNKLEALKDHKKGLLQNLFPSATEGERSRIPNYRFPEFEKDGEWVIRSIDKNIDLISGIALKSEELTDDRSGIPILRGINITEGQIRHSEEIDKFFLGDTSAIEKYLVKENDIVIGMDGSKVGKNVALISKQDAGSILIQRVARIKAINSDVNYLYQHFLSDGFKSYVDIVNTSSGIPHISAKQIRDFEIGFPPKIKEQQKIASCLSAVDELITAQSQKIEQLQAHKKGLMQGLFPKIKS